MYKIFPNSQDTYFTFSKTKLSKRREEKVVHYKIEKSPTYPARELAPTFLFVPSKIITLKLRLKLSLLISFLYTSLLLTLW